MPRSTALLVAQPESVVVAAGGATLCIHRAPLGGARLRDIRAAVEHVARSHPGGVPMCSVFRLSPRFPLRPGFDSNVLELAETLRAIERRLVAVAMVVEFGEAFARALRAATHTVWALARPRAELGEFTRIADAAAWLAPRGAAVGALDDAAAYVRLYRAAERALEAQDAGTPSVATLARGA